MRRKREPSRQNCGERGSGAARGGASSVPVPSDGPSPQRGSWTHPQALIACDGSLPPVACRRLDTCAGQRAGLAEVHPRHPHWEVQLRRALGPREAARRCCPRIFKLFPCSVSGARFIPTPGWGLEEGGTWDSGQTWDSGRPVEQHFLPATFAEREKLDSPMGGNEIPSRFLWNGLQSHVEIASRQNDTESSTWSS